MRMARLAITPTIRCCQTIATCPRLSASAVQSAAHNFRPTPSRQLHNLSRATSKSTVATALIASTQQNSRAPNTSENKLGDASFFSTSPPTDDAATTTSSAQPLPTLTWNDFLRLRRQRRFVNLFASVGVAASSIAVAAPLAMQYEVDDQIASMTGLDPFIAFGLTLTTVGGIGWLMGPFVGNAGFGIAHRKIKGDMSKREREFYDHIKRFRADPASSSVNNPVPDYYGEKIGSVADYRRWLKDQRAFNRKKNKNLI